MNFTRAEGSKQTDLPDINALFVEAADVEDETGSIGGNGKSANPANTWPLTPEQDRLAAGNGKHATRQTDEEEPRKPPIVPVRFSELSSSHPHLRKPIIDGVLREGETVNVISSPKIGKSWLVADLTLSVCVGSDWLGRFPVDAGRVLILDNELHPETISHRIRRVADARGHFEADYADNLDVCSLRGCLADVYDLGARLFQDITAGTYRLIVVDAFYRSIPAGIDENSNSGIAQVYNAIDHYALQLGCGFVLVHHSTKGSQAGKTVTDVGAGAGAQSRATDTHLILRPHEEPGAVVLEAAARSWPPIDPVVLRWDFPVWNVDGDLDPAALKQAKPKGQQGATVDELHDAIMSAFAIFPDGATKTDIRDYVGQHRSFGKAWIKATTGRDLVSCEVKKGNRTWPGFKRVYRDTDDDD